MATAFCVALILAAATFADFGAGERGTRLALQLTALLSYGLFWLACAGAPAARLRCRNPSTDDGIASATRRTAKAAQRLGAVSRRDLRCPTCHRAALFVPQAATVSCPMLVPCMRSPHRSNRRLSRRNSTYLKRDSARHTSKSSDSRWLSSSGTFPALPRSRY
jgi:hypothetical protein